MTLKTHLGYVTSVPARENERSKEGKTVALQGDAAVIAHFRCRELTSVIALTIKVLPEKAEGTNVFLVRENQYVQELPGSEILVSVPVKWNGYTPHTRQRGKDNVDVIIMMDDGRIVSVQCGIITRNEGKFYITAQRIWEGQAVRTRKSLQDPMEWDFVPTRSVHAYPGASYASIWSTLADAVMAKAKALGATERKSLVKAATAKRYAPTGTVQLAPSERIGWVDYFNLITGTGQLEDSDGVKYFIHFNDIVDGNEPIPMLTPSAAVIFAPDEQSGFIRPGVKKVTSVRHVTLEEALTS